jgi:hypothetical protein
MPLHVAITPHDNYVDEPNVTMQSNTPISDRVDAFISFDITWLVI